jgi:hypothetical protein
VHRLEENVSAKETLLLTEREQNASSLKLLEEAQLKIAELIKNAEDEHRNSESLQATIKRSDCCTCVESCGVCAQVLVVGWVVSLHGSYVSSDLSCNHAPSSLCQCLHAI